MPYIGNPIYQSAFVTDQFSGNGSTTAFTMSVAPAGTSNVLVAVSGVLQDPSTYGVSGNTLTFSAAPPSGTGNISCRYLGVPVTGITTTAYRTKTEFTATAGQTTFTPPSYTAGYIDVYRNGVLLGASDYTATNGTTVVLATGATAGDLITTISQYASSVLNAIPNTTGSVSSANIQTSVALTTPTLTSPTMTSPTISSGPLTIGTTALGAGNSAMMKNRIINGNMLINQRAFSGTPTNGQYTLDRWGAQLSQASKYTISQNAGSVTPPAGFTKYLGVTSSSSYSVGATDYFSLYQPIEGFNLTDLAWGTASAKTVTFSAWVYTSLTGTFSGVLQNPAQNRSYPFTFTISSANTWTQISATVPGETTGTWVYDNQVGMYVFFNLGCGTTYSGTANTWGSAPYFASTGSVSVVGTSGATFYVTGVQLEVGSSATAYDYRVYGTELSLCQRYYWRWNSESTSSAYLCGAFGYGTTQAYGVLKLPVTMRTAPTLTTTGTASNYGFWSGSTSIAATSVPIIETAGIDLCNMGYSSLASATSDGKGGSFRALVSSAYLGFSAEL